mgnify:CR=1 FL=1
MNGRQPSITLGNKENEKIGFLNRELSTEQLEKDIITMKSLILAQDER